MVKVQDIEEMQRWQNIQHKKVEYYLLFGMGKAEELII